MPRALPFRTLPALAAASLLALCAVAPGMATDTVADPPFADPRNKPMGDWSRMLPDLLPAIQACIGESADRPRVVLKAWPMNRGMVGVRMARTRDGAATQDCIATTGGRVDRLERPSENAEALPGQGAPVFLPLHATPPGLTCGRLERVSGRQGEAVAGYLLYDDGCTGPNAGED